MPKGSQCVEFAMECTSATCTAGPAGAKILSLNFWTGVSDGTDAIMGTATIDTAQSGRLDFCAVYFMADGGMSNGSGTGFCRPAGKHRWTTQVIMHTSHGANVLMEGVIDLATSTWTGLSHDWISEVAQRPVETRRGYRDWLGHDAA